MTKRGTGARPRSLDRARTHFRKLADAALREVADDRVTDGPAAEGRHRGKALSSGRPLQPAPLPRFSTTAINAPATPLVTTAIEVCPKTMSTGPRRTFPGRPARGVRPSGMGQ